MSVFATSSHHRVWSRFNFQLSFAHPLRVELEDILRFQIQPLLGTLHVTGISNVSGSLNLYVNDQLFQLRLDREEAQKNTQSVQESLRAYMLPKGAVLVLEAGPGSGDPTVGLGPSIKPMMPQLGESFLDRLVELATMNSDIEYRQRLTDRIIEESVAIARLERELGFYEEISGALMDSGPSSGDVDREGELLSIRSRLGNAFDGVVASIDQMNAIYEELSSQNLNPTTLLYTSVAPFTMRTERALAGRILILYGMLVFMVSLIVVPLGCLGHAYFQTEIVLRETAGHLAGRALGGPSEGQREQEPADGPPALDGEARSA